MNIDWLSFIEKFGVPLFILAFFAYFVASSIRWLANNVVLSLQARHIQFLDKVEANISAIQESHAEIKETQAKILDAQEDALDAIEDIAEILGVVDDDDDEQQEVEEKAKNRRAKN